MNSFFGLFLFSILEMILCDHEKIKDHPNMRIYLSYALEERFSVAHAIDDTEAKRRLQQENFDLLLIDYRLGDNEKTGLQLVEEFRQQYPHIPSMIITAYPTDDLLAECDSKAIPLVSKPVDKSFCQFVDVFLICFHNTKSLKEAYEETKKYIDIFSEPGVWRPKEHSELFIQFYLDVYRIALKWMRQKTNDWDEAEQLVQDAFLYIWNQPNLTFASHQMFFQYLWKTLEDRWKNWLKKEIKKPRVVKDIFEIKDTSTPAEKRLEFQEMEERLWKAMGKLSEQERYVIQKHYIEGETYQQISEPLGMTQEAIQKISQRTRKKIKKFVHF